MTAPERTVNSMLLEAARATIERLESEACQFRARIAVRDHTIRDLRADLRTARGADE